LVSKRGECVGLPGVTWSRKMTNRSIMPSGRDRKEGSGSLKPLLIDGGLENNVSSLPHRLKVLTLHGVDRETSAWTSLGRGGALNRQREKVALPLTRRTKFDILGCTMSEEGEKRDSRTIMKNPWKGSLSIGSLRLEKRLGAFYRIRRLKRVFLGNNRKGRKREIEEETQVRFTTQEEKQTVQEAELIWKRGKMPKVGNRARGLSVFRKMAKNHG